MLNDTWNKRNIEYQNLTNFTKKANDEIEGIVSALTWTIESIQNDDDSRLICPYDSSHRIGRKTLNRHLKSCQWKKEGYHELDVPLSEPNLSFDSPSALNLDVHLQSEILREAAETDSSMNVDNYDSRTWHNLYTCTSERLIPRTSDRIFSDFTRDERRVLHEYVVSHTVKPDIGHDITDTRKLESPNQDDKQLSFLELLVQERNLKRRRAKHKGVHTNKKSHTEILREVINQQMEMYNDYMIETSTASHGSKTTEVAEIRNSYKSHNDVSSPFHESQSKRRNVFREDSQDRHRTSDSRYDSKFERSEKRNASFSKARDKLEKYSRTIDESWRKQKHGRRRSDSRECDYETKGKHRSSRRDCRRDNAKDSESGSSYDGNRYTKRSDNDRRRDREKLITRMS